ncbi:hypothetical protein QS795_008090 [Providencia zhijiangensis]|uniref:RiboL-PSP-HEPN domain-containing protein n=1 Tax=Providencia zhijiangensis TaxID=3053982 RepID=A0ABZ0N6Z1_9GAMM|nr:HEPN domain-containing protein [Providencia sp. D4759]WPA93706.1 hypothetical protein QS795_008090 [Providencia sp. D4759]
MISDIFKDCREFHTIDSMYNDYCEDEKLIETIQRDNVEIVSFYQSHKRLFTKSFVIMCSNAFEKRMTQFLPKLLSGELRSSIESDSDSIQSGNSNFMTIFFEKMVFKRGYHTLFEWDNERNPNANKFVSNFGKEFRNQFRSEIDSEENSSYKNGERLFILIGELRNQLVHIGLYDYELDPNKSIHDYYKEYNEALKFCCFLLEKINEKAILSLSKKPT